MASVDAGKARTHLSVLHWALRTLAAAIVAASGLLSAAATPVAADAPADLEAFFDAFIAEAMAAHHLPGVTLAVVMDGDLALAKGYGYADIERGVPVDAAATLFDAGSVAKLFTATAVMQLAEQGRLDLHADVNRYLTRFQIPAAFPEPVTAAHLLTHTAGFDEWDLGAAVRSADEVLPVCEYLAQALPPRLRPPGQISAYSNHGSALAGCLVEEVSGQPFADYVREHIFRPLGMAHSTFAWPPELMAQMATGYRQQGESWQAMPRVFRHYGPAGELKTTAADMARFMIAHLQQGRYQDARFLQSETAQAMQRQQFSYDPRLPGHAYGFFEDAYNGRRVLVHGGDTQPTFSALLVLLPEENAGLFVAHNTAEFAFRQALVQAFMDRYFPAPPYTPPQPLPDHGRRAAGFAGSFMPSFQMRQSNPEKLFTLFTLFRVTAARDGYLTLHEPGRLAGGEPSRWVEAAPLTFQRLDQPDLMRFFPDDRGRITFMATSLYPAVAFLPVPWHAAPTFHLALLAGEVLVFISALLVWLQQRRGGSGAALARRLGALLGGLGLLFLPAMLLALQLLAVAGMFGAPLWLRALLAVPVVVGVLALLVLGLAMRDWRAGAGALAGRVHTTLVALAGLAFTWQMAYWNLVFFRL